MNTWTKLNKLPNEEGRFWLHGRVWGDEKPKLHIMQSVKIANGYMQSLRGSMLFDSDIEGEFFITPLHDPELPNNNNVANS